MVLTQTWIHIAACGSGTFETYCSSICHCVNQPCNPIYVLLVDVNLDIKAIHAVLVGNTDLVFSTYIVHLLNIN